MESEYKRWKPEGSAADVYSDLELSLEECEDHYLTGADAEIVMEKKNYQADIKECEALGMTKANAIKYINKLYKDC